MKDQVNPFMSDISQSCFILIPKIKVDEVEKHHLKSQKLNQGSDTCTDSDRTPCLHPTIPSTIAPTENHPHSTAEQAALNNRSPNLKLPPDKLHSKPQINSQQVLLPGCNYDQLLDVLPTKNHFILY